MTTSAIHPRQSTWGPLTCLMVLLLASVATAADEKSVNVDPVFVGFSGTIEGTMVDRKSNGKTVGLKVTAATPDAASRVKDAGPLIGKPLTTGVRWEKKDGTWAALQADCDFVISLKPGDPIVVTLKYQDSLGVMRMSAAPARK